MPQLTVTKTSPAQRLPQALWVFCVVLGLPTVNHPNWGLRQDTLGERTSFVLMVWAVLALQALVLHWMVRPYPPRWRWLRILPCMAGVAFLLLGLTQMQTWDLGPPFVYTLGLFPILATLALIVIGVHRGLSWLPSLPPRRTPQSPPAA